MKKNILILMAAICVLLASSISAPAGILSVPLIEQQQEQWCWAASCQMILSYYGTSTAQCTMANYCFGQSSCCNNVVWPNGTGTSCNQPNWIFDHGGDMADVLSYYGGVSGSGYYSALGWSTLVSEIDGGHPFVIGFSWLPDPPGGGHAMVGRGYDGSYYVYYNDPWPGNGYMKAGYNWMVSASDHVWDESYTTRSSGGGSTYRVLAGGDYNGDEYDDIAIFRPSSGLWAIRGITRVYWGVPGDIPVPGDYNGNGVTDIGIFRPSSGLWAIRGYNRVYFGTSADTPVPADYTGYGICNLAIFRPSSGLWAIRGGPRYYFGIPGDIPVPGPYKGGGKAIITIFRQSTGLWALKDIERGYFGRSGDIPVPGNYLNRGDWQIGIYRPSTGLWAISRGARVYFGVSSDQPVPADYQGGYADEMAIFRPSSGLWAIRGGNRYYHGRSGDIPVTR